MNDRDVFLFFLLSGKRINLSNMRNMDSKIVIKDNCVSLVLSNEYVDVEYRKCFA